MSNCAGIQVIEPQHRALENDDHAVEDVVELLGDVHTVVDSGRLRVEGDGFMPF